MVPSFVKAGLSFVRTDMDVSGRIPSSVVIMTCLDSPEFGSTIFNGSKQDQSLEYVEINNIETQLNIIFQSLEI